MQSSSPEGLLINAIIFGTLFKRFFNNKRNIPIMVDYFRAKKKKNYYTCNKLLNLLFYLLKKLTASQNHVDPSLPAWQLCQHLCRNNSYAIEAEYEIATHCPPGPNTERSKKNPFKYLFWIGTYLPNLLWHLIVAFGWHESF